MPFSFEWATFFFPLLPAISRKHLLAIWRYFFVEDRQKKPPCIFETKMCIRYFDWFKTMQIYNVNTYTNTFTHTNECILRKTRERDTETDARRGEEKKKKEKIESKQSSRREGDPFQRFPHFSHGWAILLGSHLLFAPCNLCTCLLRIVQYLNAFTNTQTWEKIAQ